MKGVHVPKTQQLNGRKMQELIDTIHSKLHGANFRLEDGAKRTIINLDSSEITVLCWALAIYRDAFIEQKEGNT